MYPNLIGAGLAAFMGFAFVEGSKDPQIQLRGDRFRPLTYEEMTPEQRTMTDHILAGKRGSMDGPYNVLLRSPEMGDLAQKYGAHMRFNSSLPKKLNELAILMIARAWNSPFEWYVHRTFAMESGLSAEVIEMLATGQPTSMDPAEDAVYNFCDELLNTRRVSDATFHKAKEMFGERGIVDLIGVMGYYHLVSMLLNVDRYPMPEGVKDELSSLR
jgi:4-carboxymuconolactone decarboxylase